MEKRQSKYLINQDTYYISWVEGTGSGWNYDGRGAKKLERDKGPYSISNVSGKYPTALVRETQVGDSGIFTVETFADIKSGFDGFLISMYDKDENDIMRLFTNDGCFYALGEGFEPVKLLDCAAKCERYYFRIILDFYTKTVTYYINSKLCGAVPMLADSFKFYKVGTLSGHIIDVVPGKLDLYADFITNSSFITTAEGDFPFDWKKTDNADAFVSKNDELHVKNGAVSTEFEKADGKFTLEAYVYTPENKGAYDVSLISAGKSALNITFENGNVSAGGKVLRPFRYDLWYILRVSVDTDKHKAYISLNAKEPYEVDFGADFTDGLKFECRGGAELWLDDIKMWYDIEYADYCPRPVPAKGYGKYNVGINMCSMWRTGDHVGWDRITPFPETRPVIGYYDEGLPEVADWEIKFMVENGINMQFYCWYTDGFQRTIPLKRTRLNNALVDGFLCAKYSDMMQFGLLWEANGGRPENSEMFRKNFVPYWIENFFSDKRYARIDNKAIMGVFAPQRLIEEFGSPEALKEEFDYLRSEVSKLGYDGMVIFCSATPSETLYRAGFDACYAYNWGINGNNADYMINRSKAMKRLEDIMHFIPTASTGFNRLAWGSPRVPCVSVSGFKKINLYMRDKLLPSYENLPEWTKKFVMLSNWNEYGEGTYIMPSGLNGFGYVNVIRDVYTDGRGEGAKDVKPTAKQLKRLSYLYPQDRKTIRPLELRPKIVKNIDFDESRVTKKLIIDDEHWKTDEVKPVNSKNCVSFVSVGNDAKAIYTDTLDIPCEKATHMRIVMDSSDFDNGVVYFRTTSSPEWCSRNAAGFNVKKGKHEYLINLSNGRPGNDPYVGNLLSVRIDPSEIPLVTTKIYSAEIFYTATSEKTKQLFIDGANVILDNPYAICGEHVMIPIFNERMTLYRLGAYYEWNAPEKKLSIFANNRSIFFYIGTNKAVINGETVYLDCVPYLDDGLPMVPADLICKVFGYDFKVENENLYIKTNF